MIHYHSQDTVSEDLSLYYPPGSSLACDPQEEYLYCQPNLGGYPSPSSIHSSTNSPSDSSWAALQSELVFSDWGTVSSASSISGSMADEWTPSPGQDCSSTAQPSDYAWLSQGAPVTTQGLSALDNATRFCVPTGTVASGLSPVLSYTSQNSYTHPAVSDPEPLSLPNSAEFSFKEGREWSAHGPVMYTGPASNGDASAFAPLLAYGHSGMPADCTDASAVGDGLCQQPHTFSHQDVHARLPLRKTSGPHVQSHSTRPLLPRTGMTTPISPRPTPEPVGVQRPYMQGSQRSHGVPSKVSMRSDQLQYGYHGAPSLEGPPGQATMVPMQASTLPYSSQAQFSTCYPIRPDTASYSQPAGPMVAYAYDSATELAYFDLDPMGTAPLPATMSYSLDSAASYPLSANMSGNFQNVPVTPERQSQVGLPGPGASNVVDRAADTSSPTTAMDREECRYRTDKLYFQPPHEDGLYHCPLEDDVAVNCNHKPTKLKCNYDKYIDSHLKPFACKVIACDGQKFSSTACLLRHEREAHAMHGHGDRPFSCLYPGCERAPAGAGFPRRFNQLDHMKRVHGYTVETSSVMGSNDLATENPNQRTSGTRKRESAAQPSAKVEAQRQKTMPSRSAQRPQVIERAHPRNVGRASSQSMESAARSQPMQRTYRSMDGMMQLPYQEDPSEASHATQGHAAELRRLSGQRG